MRVFYKLLASTVTNRHMIGVKMGFKNNTIIIIIRYSVSHRKIHIKKNHCSSRLYYKLNDLLARALCQ